MEYLLFGLLAAVIVGQQVTILMLLRQVKEGRDALLAKSLEELRHGKEREREIVVVAGPPVPDELDGQWDDSVEVPDFNGRMF